MDPLQRFSGRVVDYDKYRPSYPSEILDVFRKSFGFDNNFIIADIGSGTGIMSKIFLENGNRVYTVEPNFEMRQAAEMSLKYYPNFISVDGTAENTKLPSDIIDLTIVAQAFHWFNPGEFAKELIRISGEKAYLSIVWNERLVNIDPFHFAYEQLILEYSTDYKEVDHRSRGYEKLLQLNPIECYAYFELDNKQKLTFEGLKGRLLSSSYVPQKEEAGPLIEQLRSLFDDFQLNGAIDLKYITKIYILPVIKLL